MRIQPVSGPHAVQQTTTNETAQKAKAVAAFKAGKSTYDQAPQAQDTPVQNPNQVSVEELSAIQTQPRSQDDTEHQEQGQGQEQETSPEQHTVEDKPVKEEPKDPALSRQFAQLARQERALRAKAMQQQQDFKTQKQAIEAEKASLEAKVKDYESGYISRQSLKDNTLLQLAEAGVSYEDLTNQILQQQEQMVNPQTAAIIKRLESKIAGLEKAQEDNKTQQTQAHQEQRATAVRQINVDVTDLIKSNPIAYEAISKIGPKGVKETVRLIVDTYDKGSAAHPKGYVMSPEEAADAVENYLIEENYSMANSISKIKKRLLESGQTKRVEEKIQPNTEKTHSMMKTLTNAAASTRKLTAKERAILAFKNELK